MEKITQKLAFTLILGAIAVLPGCGGKQGKVVEVNPSNKQVVLADMPVGLNDSTKTAYFDEDVESFVLDDADMEDFYRRPTQVAAHEKDLDFQWTDEDNAQVATVLFGYDSRTPRPDQGEAIDKADRIALKLHKEGKIICLKGHACKWRGTSAYNLAISVDRPETVKRHLVEDLGIPANRIKVFGVGNEEPVTLADNKDAQGANRRVEVYGVSA